MQLSFQRLALFSLLACFTAGITLILHQLC
ncbi:hypothetical protein ABIE06_004184 [Pantoea dispersa]